MSAYTPGPWKHLGGSYAGRVVDENREVVATVNGVSRGGRGRLGSPTANANARLIAAAPELLEAATAAWALIMSLADPDSVWLKTRDRLVAAISKAEGGS